MRIKVEVCAKCLYMVERKEYTEAEKLAIFLRTDHDSAVVPKPECRTMHADPSGRTWCAECWGTDAARDARRAAKYVAIVNDKRANEHERDTARRRLAELPPVVYTPPPPKKRVPPSMEQFLAEWHLREKEHKERMREIDARFKRRLRSIAEATVLGLMSTVLFVLIGKYHLGTASKILAYATLGVGLLFQQKVDWGATKVSWRAAFLTVGGAIAIALTWFAVALVFALRGGAA